ncbi:hypothetical protein M409DRAFT_26114 [Zasmidium cellare ATCC 36951]|uniref:Uncharacterized protein n=1 Tax=Zasmidium cellare ATCC 36951 TaxID=1080233 RepID=A0A6A6CC66_ZASCE|nr:uncharacterized protein M409DRAFT_26114 [Zasmidium cellare ATCC 36951]KAF2163502.1 hypothetical protein M409DRAFT_26114 [Zasmidium cellare ATCC 36951]
MFEMPHPMLYYLFFLLVETTFASYPARAPWAGLETYARRNYFYAGGKYINATQTLVNQTAQYLVGQVYAEQLTPFESRYEIPLVFIAGAGQSATNWLNTPDGREGWASFFLRHGYTVYLVDQAQRGRSPWLPGEGAMLQFPVSQVEKQFTAPQDYPSYPQAMNHTQWPGTGLQGDPIFDGFMRSQLQAQTNSTMQSVYNNLSFNALLDDIGPAIVIPHSEAGMYGWQLGDARPDLVKAIVALEPAGPPFADYSGPPFEPGLGSSSGKRPFGLTMLPLQYSPPIGSNASLLTQQNHSAPNPNLAPCILQKKPARRLTNLSKIPTLLLTSQASYHAVYDYCTVYFLKQAGVDVEWIHLPDVGVYGNGHFVFMERNNLEIAQLVEPWIAEHAAGVR